MGSAVRVGPWLPGRVDKDLVLLPPSTSTRLHFTSDWDSLGWGWGWGWAGIGILLTGRFEWEELNASLRP